MIVVKRLHLLHMTLFVREVSRLIPFDLYVAFHLFGSVHLKLLEIIILHILTNHLHSLQFDAKMIIINISIVEPGKRPATRGEKIG
jgi:hypothetical protein